MVRFFIIHVATTRLERLLRRLPALFPVAFWSPPPHAPHCSATMPPHRRAIKQYRAGRTGCRTTVYTAHTGTLFTAASRTFAGARCFPTLTPFVKTLLPVPLPHCCLLFTAPPRLHYCSPCYALTGSPSAFAAFCAAGTHTDYRHIFTVGLPLLRTFARVPPRTTFTLRLNVAVVRSTPLFCPSQHPHRLLARALHSLAYIAADISICLSTLHGRWTCQSRLFQFASPGSLYCLVLTELRYACLGFGALRSPTPRGTHTTACHRPFYVTKVCILTVLHSHVGACNSRHFVPTGR